MSDYNSSYLLHGEIAPFLQDKTKNRTQIARSGGNANAWDQTKNETPTSYSAFLLYLDLGAHNRSHSKLGKIIYGNDQSIGQITKWSVEHDWLNRADSWDRYCTENRLTKMEEAVYEGENVMLSYLPKVVLNLAQTAAGEKNIGRAQMRAITDFLDRVGPAKQQRSNTTINNNNLTVQAPALPDGVVSDTGEIQDAEIIQEEANRLIPGDLRNKRGKS